MTGMLSRQPLSQYPAGQQGDTLLNMHRLLEQHSLQLRQIGTQPISELYGLSSDKWARPAI